MLLSKLLNVSCHSRRVLSPLAQSNWLHRIHAQACATFIRSSYNHPVCTNPSLFSLLAALALLPLPQIDIIGAMMIVWRLRGKIIMCSVQYCVQQLCTMQCTHMNRPNSSLDWVLSHWANFTVLRFIFVYVCILCLLSYTMCYSIVAWWSGPGGIEAWSLLPLLPSVFWHCLFSGTLNCTQSVKHLLFISGHCCSSTHIILVMNKLIVSFDVLHLVSGTSALLLHQSYPRYRQHCAQRNVSVFKLLRGRFWVFCPAGATRCTDGGEIWHGGGDQRSHPPCQISPPSVQQ